MNKNWLIYYVSEEVSYNKANIIGRIVDMWLASVVGAESKEDAEKKFRSVYPKINNPITIELLENVKDDVSVLLGCETTIKYKNE